MGYPGHRGLTLQGLCEQVALWKKIGEMIPEDVDPIAEESGEEGSECEDGQRGGSEPSFQRRSSFSASLHGDQEGMETSVQ